MRFMTKAEVLSETRKIAADLSLTFKEDTEMKFYTGKAYILTDRKTGNVLLKNLTLETGYGNALNGCFHQVAQNITKEKIADTIRYFLKLDMNAERDYEFIAKVSKYLDDNYGINVADNDYAHEKLIEQLDIFFD